MRHSKFLSCDSKAFKRSYPYLIMVALIIIHAPTSVAYPSALNTSASIISNALMSSRKPNALLRTFKFAGFL